MFIQFTVDIDPRYAETYSGHYIGSDLSSIEGFSEFSAEMIINGSAHFDINSAPEGAVIQFERFQLTDAFIINNYTDTQIILNGRILAPNTTGVAFSAFPPVGGNVPHTGDSASPLLYAVLMLAALAGVALFISQKRKA